MENRKVIERAKGILIKRTGLAEPDAFRRLQKLASSKSQKMVEVAQSIVTAFRRSATPNGPTSRVVTNPLIRYGNR
ncbi:MAG: ANTAR domain-containing protein [Planctomycetaceae bacterium]|nr:MAG: ANTAR domain-containing protein [Planctomycetaceae bacterium]